MTEDSFIHFDNRQTFPTKQMAVEYDGQTPCGLWADSVSKEENVASEPHVESTPMFNAMITAIEPTTNHSSADRELWEAEKQYNTLTDELCTVVTTHVANATQVGEYNELASRRQILVERIKHLRTEIEKLQRDN